MTPYRTENASASCRWTCAQMLTALPSPGTPQFAKLAASLQPYGIEPRGITFEAPSSRMSDVTLNFLLLRGELRIKVTYDGFEIIAGQLLDEHIPMAAALVSIAHEAIRDSSGDGAAGRYEITYSAHLSLAPGEAVRILHEHLTRFKDEALIPDAFSYRLAQ